MERPIFADLVSGWENYQSHLIAAIRPLTAEQLALRPSPDLRSIGMIAAHVVGARARWLRQVLGEGPGELDAWTGWGRPESPVPGGEELAQALDVSWQTLRAGLERWTAADYEEKLTRERRGQMMTFTRGWVVWHLIEHDLHHGGEISLLLGMHGLPAVDI